MMMLRASAASRAQWTVPPAAVQRLFELLQISVQIGERMCADSSSGRSQFLPILLLRNQAVALCLNHISRVGNILSQLGSAESGSAAAGNGGAIRGSMMGALIRGSIRLLLCARPVCRQDELSLASGSADAVLPQDASGNCYRARCNTPPPSQVHLPSLARAWRSTLLHSSRKMCRRIRSTAPGLRAEPVRVRAPCSTSETAGLQHAVPQPVATRVIGHAMWKIRSHVLHVEVCQLEIRSSRTRAEADAAKCFRRSSLPQLLKQSGVLVANHRDAGR